MFEEPLGTNTLQEVVETAVSGRKQAENIRTHTCGRNTLEPIPGWHGRGVSATNEGISNNLPQGHLGATPHSRGIVNTPWRSAFGTTKYIYASLVSKTYLSCAGMHGVLSNLYVR